MVMTDQESALVCVTQSVTSTALVLTLDGEIDLASRHTLDSRLREAVSTLPPPDLVVVDLTSVRFFAVEGFRLLRELTDGCRPRGLRIRLVAAPDSVVARIFRIACPDDLPVSGSVAEALLADF